MIVYSTPAQLTIKGKARVNLKKINLKKINNRVSIKKIKICFKKYWFK